MNQQEFLADHNAWRQWSPAFLRALTGSRTGKKTQAILAAHQWAQFGKNRFARKQLMEDLQSRVMDALKTSDADFFRDFADALETKGMFWSRTREWLALKHEPKGAFVNMIRAAAGEPPIEHGPAPRFTHEQLLADAERNGITITDRQLRRLMRELGFKFKNARPK